MSTKLTITDDVERLVQAYREDTGKDGVEAEDLAHYARSKGYPIPEPETPIALLTKKFSRVLGRAKRTDEVTGNPYHAYQHIMDKHGQGRLDFWYDTDEAPREIMVESLRERDEQILGDVMSKCYDAEHWNRIHPMELPLEVITDYTFQSQVRLNAPKMIDGD